MNANFDRAAAALSTGGFADRLEFVTACYRRDRDGVG
jgi:hypothetical protein